MPRTRWTDERLNELAAIGEPLAAEVARNTEAIGRLTEEVRSFRRDMSPMRSDPGGDLSGDLSAFQRQIAQFGWALSAVLLGILIALIVAAG